MNIAVIHGYGRVNMDNPFYQTYMHGLLNHFEGFHCDAIVCSGGFTDKNIHQSEADSLREALMARGSFTHVQRYLEEDSFTTYHNVVNVGKILSRIDQIENVYVFCSNIHIPKIIYQSLQTYLHISKHDTLEIIQNLRIQSGANPNLQGDCLIAYKHIKFIGIDLHWEEPMIMKALRSNVIETHYDEFDDLHDTFVDYRKKLRGLA